MDFFKIGQKVLVKSWTEMEQEYGLDENGNIATPSLFVPKMKKYCGKYVTIVDNTPPYYIREDNGDYLWDEEMFNLFDKNLIHCYLEARRSNGKFPM